MILTVTPNLAVDVTYGVDRIRTGDMRAVTLSGGPGCGHA